MCIRLELCFRVGDSFDDDSLSLEAARPSMCKYRLRLHGGVYFVLWPGLGYGIHHGTVLEIGLAWLGLAWLGLLGLACLAWLGLACSWRRRQQLPPQQEQPQAPPPAARGRFVPPFVVVVAEGAAAADDAKNKPGQAKNKPGQAEQARPSQASQAKSGLAKPAKPKGGVVVPAALFSMRNKIDTAILLSLQETNSQSMFP